MNARLWSESRDRAFSVIACFFLDYSICFENREGAGDKGIWSADRNPFTSWQGWYQIALFCFSAAGIYDMIIWI